MHMHALHFLAAWSALVYEQVFAHHVLHEKRSAPPPDWSKRSLLDAKSVIPLKFALHQSNMHLAEKFLMDVSHPKSENYGRHWTPRKVAETFASR
jgi:tripeptidyl-peptidase-1